LRQKFHFVVVFGRKNFFFTDIVTLNHDIFCVLLCCNCVQIKILLLFVHVSSNIQAHRKMFIMNWRMRSYLLIAWTIFRTNIFFMTQIWARPMCVVSNMFQTSVCVCVCVWNLRKFLKITTTLRFHFFVARFCQKKNSYIFFLF
jgi:hypothetical protein